MFYIFNGNFNIKVINTWKIKIYEFESQFFWDSLSTVFTKLLCEFKHQEVIQTATTLAVRILITNIFDVEHFPTLHLMAIYKINFIWEWLHTVCEPLRKSQHEPDLYGAVQLTTVSCSTSLVSSVEWSSLKQPMISVPNHVTIQLRSQLPLLLSSLQ